MELRSSRLWAVIVLLALAGLIAVGLLPFFSEDSVARPTVFLPAEGGSTGTGAGQSVVRSSSGADRLTPAAAAAAAAAAATVADPGSQVHGGTPAPPLDKGDTGPLSHGMFDWPVWAPHNSSATAVAVAACAGASATTTGTTASGSTGASTPSLPAGSSYATLRAILGARCPIQLTDRARAAMQRWAQLHQDMVTGKRPLKAVRWLCKSHCGGTADRLKV